LILMLGAMASAWTAAPAYPQPARANVATGSVPTLLASTFKQAWDTECDPTGCATSPVTFVDFATPQSSGPVKFVATLTFDYAVIGKNCVFWINLFAESHFLGKMAPGQFVLRSPGSDLTTTATLTWLSDIVPGDGATYQMLFADEPHFYGQDPAFVRGTRGTVVIQILPAQGTAMNPGELRSPV
jgi:hypothetical protein